LLVQVYFYWLESVSNSDLSFVGIPPKFIKVIPDFVTFFTEPELINPLIASNFIMDFFVMFDMALTITMKIVIVVPFIRVKVLT
tara:strand:- start:215 stop:466 length:252 start_codon:yes stop_codon:yes gene_type:complete